MRRACPTPLSRCWLAALRVSWRDRLEPDAASDRLSRLLAVRRLDECVDAFTALIPALYADGARCLDIRSPNAPDTSLDETALLEALAALCLDDPLGAESALAGLFPPGRGRRSLRLLEDIASESRRMRPAIRHRRQPEGTRLH